MNLKDHTSLPASELEEHIRQSREFLVVTHVFPDGDAMGSITSFSSLLKKIGKRPVMVCNSSLPYQYSFLPGFDEVKREEDVEGIYEGKRVCIVLDCADAARTGMDLDRLRDSGNTIINIDHHRSNDRFGDINLVESEKSSTCEMIFDLIDNYHKEVMDRDIALGIYVGILTDTGRFQYGNTTARIHHIAGRLLEYGINPAAVYSHIYESDPLARFGLIQSVLERVRYIEPLSLIYSYVLDKDFKRLKIPYYSQDGIIDLLRSARGARVAALIKQTDRSSFKISLRSSDTGLDLSRIAGSFGGGGHRTASAYSYKGRIRRVISSLKQAVKEEMER